MASTVTEHEGTRIRGNECIIVARAHRSSFGHVIRQEQTMFYDWLAVVYVR